MKSIRAKNFILLLLFHFFVENSEHSHEENCDTFGS